MSKKKLLTSSLSLETINFLGPQVGRLNQVGLGAMYIIIGKILTFCLK